MAICCIDIPVSAARIFRAVLTDSGQILIMIVTAFSFLVMIFLSPDTPRLAVLVYSLVAHLNPVKIDFSSVLIGS